MLIKVLKVTKNGKTGYLKTATIFGIGGQNPVVDNPAEAKNYADPQFEKDLEKDISHLRLPNKTYSAMSGVSVDSAHIVEIEVKFTEISSIEAYTPPETSNKPKM